MNGHSSIDFPVLLPLLSLFSLLLSSLLFDNHNKLVSGECCYFSQFES